MGFRGQFPLPAEQWLAGRTGLEKPAEAIHILVDYMVFVPDFFFFFCSLFIHLFIYLFFSFHFQCIAEARTHY